jgi:hypothetical protein
MKAIRYRFFNIVNHKPMSTVYTALVKRGETFFGNPEGVALRRCKYMIVHEGKEFVQANNCRYEVVQ